MIGIFNEIKARRLDSQIVSVDDDKTTRGAGAGAGKLSHLPEEIRELLTSVADRYDVEPEQIFSEYEKIRDRIGKYTLNELKFTLENAGHSFETGLIRLIKLKYTDTIEYEELTLHKLTADNSIYDLIEEISPLETVCYELGVEHILTNRVRALGVTTLSKASNKEDLLQYLWQLYDFVAEYLLKPNQMRLSESGETFNVKSLHYPKSSPMRLSESGDHTF